MAKTCGVGGHTRLDYKVFRPPDPSFVTPPPTPAPVFGETSFGARGPSLNRLNALLADAGCGEPSVTSSPWSWLGSIMFAFTLVTTVGFGNFSIASEASKGFLVAFSLIGIVTFGWVNVQIVMRVRRFIVSRRAIAEDQFEDKDRRPNICRDTALVLALAFAYLLFGAAMHHREDQNGDGTRDSFGNAFWFAFISCTTIGLGDYVIQTADGLWFVINVAYIMTGLALVGMALDALAVAAAHAAQEKNLLEDVAAQTIQRCVLLHLRRPSRVTAKGKKERAVALAGGDVVKISL